MVARVIYLIVLLLLVFWAPWWLFLFVWLVGIIRFQNFYELILPAFAFDTLHGVAGVTPVGFPLMLSVFTVAGVYLAEEIKYEIAK